MIRFVRSVNSELSEIRKNLAHVFVERLYNTQLLSLATTVATLFCGPKTSGPSVRIAARTQGKLRYA